MVDTGVTRQAVEACCPDKARCAQFRMREAKPSTVSRITGGVSTKNPVPHALTSFPTQDNEKHTAEVE